MEKIVNTHDQEGKEFKLVVKKPNNKVLQDATVAYNAKIAELLRANNSLMLRAELEKHLTERGIWTVESAKRFTDIAMELRDLEVKLRKGGIKISEGREYAIKMSELRQEQVSIYTERKQYDSITIEAVAEEHKLAFILSKCTFREDGKTLYFTNLDECIKKNSEIASLEASRLLFGMVFGEDDNLEQMYETKWLQKYNLMDKKKRLTNKNGELVTKENKLINESGALIDEDGKQVDVLGNRIDPQGNLLIEEMPFIDDSTGEPIVFENKTKRKKKRKKNE
jgi:hypothetical protein